MSTVIVKFGGTSVSSAPCWQNITRIVKQHLAAGKRPIVVCSAPSGVSNLLETLLTVEPEQKFLELREKFSELNRALNLNCDTLIQNQFVEIRKLIDGVAFLGEVTPRVQARVMAFGELLLTQLGEHYLASQGLSVHWQDARQWLQAVEIHNFHHPDAYLDAHCQSDVEINLQHEFAAIRAEVVITQGFIARNSKNETVLLGRGGSDTSAAYLACKLGAESCEIWTDVPGIYTANPKTIPQARMITRLDYDEAQEIASMGAKVLHPKCISPVRAHNIPLIVRYTPDPDRPGTEVSVTSSHKQASIKSILTKHNIILISIETMKMWHRVGFLAEVFTHFKKHGVSIDLVSTSESSVTVSLDAGRQEEHNRVLDALLNDLNQFARATVIAPCASVSLVGRNIRAILHQLGEVFSVFEEQKIYLVSQAANDLNLTFVVDEDQAARLASKLHALLIEGRHNSEPWRMSFAEEFGAKQQLELPWWQEAREKLLQMAEKESPCYVYSQAELKKLVNGLKECQAVDRLFYSMKANNNVDVLRIFYAAGIGFECVSLEELKWVRQLFPKITPERISFTPNFAPLSEYKEALAQGVFVTVDSLYPFTHWVDSLRNQKVLLRVDIGKGSGHHKYVVTGGDQSKFGIPLSALPEVSRIAKDNNIEIIGLHSHAGSGILDAEHWARVFTSLNALRAEFPAIKFINVGGGLGVVERASQSPLSLLELNASLARVKDEHPDLELWLEPGRYLVATAGVLLAKVTQIKQKGELNFVGIETGMNSLIRPALYGAYHEIVNLTRLFEPKSCRVNLVGPICESGDTLGYSRWLPSSREGDVILIATTGAYGHSMSSEYNLRKPAQEYLL